ncbi:OmpA family protein [Maritimibacter sp. HL-12]|uniref:OmpA family protein n=1 Tax=Maritimibacter sp. HL-12 TaxID=1162418 RepID=UPI000A0F2FE3|nr:OmpA family protein [Maritimibacter sp. HL-12]SMH40940.1 OmpA family protein [Maritimibacter sp. HL-12]
MIRLAHLLAALVAALPVAAGAADLSLPEGATLRVEDVEPAGRYALPVGPWREGNGVETESVSGSVTRQAWRIGGTGLTSYEILLDLRDQIVREGYDVEFECSTESCGGFDFRYGIEVIGAPEMHVDLGDYHFLAATAPGETPDHVSLLVSRSPSAGFVQIVHVGALAVRPAAPMTSTKAESDAALPRQIADEIGPAMEEIGRFVLADLVFETGSADLGPGSFSSLQILAEYLEANPGKRVALVGHTDAEGSLAGNLSLSKRRAASVMSRLIEDFGVDAGQLEAEGVGYLAPIASNQTGEGRTVNRRVEAILVSTQ